MIRIGRLYICRESRGTYVGWMKWPGVLEVWIGRVFISYGRRPIGGRTLDERLKRFVSRSRYA